MESVKPETSELNIEKLRSILGEDWCAAKLAKYGRFRKDNSPTDLWSHRYPTTPPIVPLLFHHQYIKSRGEQPLLGHWYGDPIHYLKQLATSIFLFEDYWSQLPDNIGIKNIRYKLTHPDQFNSFIFELLVAVDSRFYKYKSYQVHPDFFNPRASKGGGDIIIKRGAEEIAIQCKTRNPLTALEMSFDTFQYVFGCFYRLVQDSGRSYKLTINIKRRLENKEIYELINSFKGAVKTGLELPKYKKDNAYDIELSRLSVPIEGVNSKMVYQLLDKEKANLFIEVGALNPFGKNVDRFNRIAILAVSASHSESIEESIFNIVLNAAREATVKSQLILAIHLIGYIEWEKYLSDRVKQKKLDMKLDPILKSHKNIRCLRISSNKQQYVDVPDGAQYMQTPHLEISNKYFAV